jgi:dihydroorotate dehydrogenase (NAD+) catalytic subunit
VHQALPELPIVGSGGVDSGADVVEFLLAGASAIGVGTAHFASPRIGRKIMKELRRYMHKHRITDLEELVGAAQPW